MEAKNATTPPPAKEEVKGFFAKNRVWIILLLALAVGNAGTYLYQRHQLSEQKEAFDAAMVTKANQAEELTVYRAKRSAEEMTTAFVNTIRGEMLRGNKELLNLYMIDLVQTTGASLVTVVDSVGMVYLSTDKKFENQFILDVLPVMPPRVDKAQTLKAGLDEVITVTPVMADDYRLGTAVMTYKADKKTIELLEQIQAAPKLEE